MMIFAPGPLARWIRRGVLVIATALVLVPAVVRARQTLAAPESIPTSIKLNWNGDAPPTKADCSLQHSLETVSGLPYVLRQPTAGPIARLPRAIDVPVPSTPRDNSPGDLRGPPLTFGS